MRSLASLGLRGEPVDEEVVWELADAAIVAEGAAKARVSWLIIPISERIQHPPRRQQPDTRTCIRRFDTSSSSQ